VSKVLLFSGGFDSASLLVGPDRSSSDIKVALFVDYRQPSRDEERRCSRTAAETAGVEFVSMRTDLILGEMSDPVGDLGPRVIAARNLMLIAVGVNVAAARGCDTVVIGSTLSDDQDYPDCRRQFIDSADRLMSDTYGIRVSAPLLGASKMDIAREAREHGYIEDLLKQSWSCYTPVVQPSGMWSKECGQCNSCVARQEIVRGSFC